MRFLDNNPPGLIDTHCHLDAAEFEADRDEVVLRALQQGVEMVFVPAVEAASFAATLAMRSRYGCRVALGLHPVYLARHATEHLALLRQALVEHRVDAVGEIGLDFFVKGLDAEQQLALLAAQLRLAREFDLPVLLHVRQAQDPLLKQLRRFGIRRGIAHAFNGSLQQAEAYIEQGLLLGFGGNLSYPRALNIRRLAVALPLESLVLETDAPDMPPHWAQSQRNEPAHVRRIAETLAELRGLALETVIAATGRNARSIFTAG